MGMVRPTESKFTVGKYFRARMNPPLICTITKVCSDRTGPIGLGLLVIDELTGQQWPRWENKYDLYSFETFFRPVSEEEQIELMLKYS